MSVLGIFLAIFWPSLLLLTVCPSGPSSSAFATPAIAELTSLTNSSSYINATTYGLANASAASQQDIRIERTMAPVVAVTPKPRKQIYKIRKEIIEKLFIKYEKTIRPYPADDGPTTVGVGLFIRRISSINELSMEFVADVLLRQIWNDPRVAYEVPSETNIPFVKMHSDSTKLLWTPDLFFASEKRGSQLHTITVPNTMLRIYPNGTILFTQRYSLVTGCDMNLLRYPFDLQRCFIQLGSFSDTVEAVQFYWENQFMESPIQLNREVRLPKFSIEDIHTLPCSNIHPTGNFSCLIGEFVFKRQLGYYLLESYIPLSMLVVASWLGFWIDANSVPGRVSLSVTTLLTTVAQATNIKHTLPPVSYVRAIDIWLGICVLYVFMALAEFALVNYLARQEENAKLAGPRHSHLHRMNLCCVRTVNMDSKTYNLTTTDDDDELPISERSLKYRIKKSKRTPVKCRAKHIDRVSRITFPLTFIMVTLAYIYVFVYCIDE